MSGRWRQVERDPVMTTLAEAGGQQLHGRGETRDGLLEVL